MFKIPYYFYLVFWIISLSINKAFAAPKSNLQLLTALIILGIPLIILFIQILKNKNKIFSLYKKGRTKFKHIFITLEALPILFLIIIALSIISLGGFKNFEERVKYEYYTKKNPFICGNPTGLIYSGWGNYSKYFFKANFQYLDYFKDHKDQDNRIIKLAKNARDDLNFNFNHCYFYGEALKETHKGNQIARDILASMPVVDDKGSSYDNLSGKNLSRYIKSIKSEKLSNPALKYNYAFAGKFERPERKKLFKESADEGYLLAMEDYIFELQNDFEQKNNINSSECNTLLKYTRYLADQNALIYKYNDAISLMGRTASSGPGLVYYCSGNKTDFSKAISKLDEFWKYQGTRPANNGFATTYPALVYYNGWGNVNKNKDLAISLFKKNLNHTSPSEISLAYLALDSFNNNDKNKARNYLKKIDEKKKVTDLVSLKKFIKKWIDDWFKNPELVKTLNIYG